MRDQLTRIALLSCLLIPFVFLHGQASHQIGPPGQQFPPPSQLPAPDDNAGRDKLERDMAKKANHERHAALQRDTNKLLDLATQLKQDVDKSTENTLSMDVVKRAEEIEKLAHSVKEKMKGN